MYSAGVNRIAWVGAGAALMLTSAYGGIDLGAGFSPTANPNAGVTFGAVTEVGGLFGGYTIAPFTTPGTTSGIVQHWGFASTIGGGPHPYCVAYRPTAAQDFGEGTIVPRGQLVLHPAIDLASGASLNIPTAGVYSVAVQAWRVGAAGSTNVIFGQNPLSALGNLAAYSGYVRPPAVTASVGYAAGPAFLMVTANDGSISWDSTAVNVSLVSVDAPGPRTWGLTDLADWVGQTQTVPVKVKLVDSFTNAVAATGSGNLLSTGHFDITLSNSVAKNAPYFVVVKPRRGLAVSTFVSGGVAQIFAIPRFTTLNGDADDDDSVSILDYIGLSTNFGLQYTDPGWTTVDPGSNIAPIDCDFDGDDEVSILDYIILSANMGLTGAW
jgi:hypothetical protein